MHLNVKRDSYAGRRRLQVLLLPCCLTSSNLGGEEGDDVVCELRVMLPAMKTCPGLHEEVLHPFEYSMPDSLSVSPGAADERGISLPLLTLDYSGASPPDSIPEDLNAWRRK
ncbi:hypothetical protein Q7C36_004150 [Tachysurus vachellii]|uniref:Uncharacterized protein n=1 Tax=Tachysurus vachellii TaxID=175792 RepID=A0AA88TAJ1_TACVA|nr:hypothetical protein Q7C36_004150 [Tachysurus vachellii]